MTDRPTMPRWYWTRYWTYHLTRHPRKALPVFLRWLMLPTCD